MPVCGGLQLVAGTHLAVMIGVEDFGQPARFELVDGPVPTLTEEGDPPIPTDRTIPETLDLLRDRNRLQLGAIAPFTLTRLDQPERIGACVGIRL